LAQGLAEAGWRVLVIDLPGFGFSGRPPAPGRHYTVAGMAELLATVVEEQGPLRVVGLGWGGGVAAELAVARPDLVTGIDLVDTVEIPVPAPDRYNLSRLPFGLGEAFAFTFEGAGGPAQGRFLSNCPVGLECGSETLDLYRRAAEVPGTSRAIWARRATPAAALAPTRLGSITADVRLLALDRSPDALGELAARFLGAEVVDLDAADLVSAFAPAPNSAAARAASP
jgi:pimeloyl-ACP methyl ester carboxylesterase